MEPIPLQNVLIVIAVATVVNGLIILTVSSLNLGLRVRGFLTALVVAIVIATIGTIVRFVLPAIGVPSLGGIAGLVERLIVTAVGLLLADKLLQGLTVHGFKGVITASLAIAVILWMLDLLLKAVGIDVPA
jgi:putative membrane protein